MFSTYFDVFLYIELGLHELQSTLVYAIWTYRPDHLTSGRILCVHVYIDSPGSETFETEIG